MLTQGCVRVAELDLPVRVYNALTRAGITEIDRGTLHRAVLCVYGTYGPRSVTALMQAYEKEAGK